MTNPNDPAFAHEGTSYVVNKELKKVLTGDLAEQIAAIPKRYSGLTKREHFAAMAMQALAADPTNDLPAGMATFAVSVADALIVALNAPEAK